MSTDVTTTLADPNDDDDPDTSGTHNDTAHAGQPSAAPLLDHDLIEFHADDEDLVDLGPAMVGDIPRVAKTTAVRRLAEILVSHGHRPGTAAAIARAVVRPEDVRRRLALPDEDRVPGGTVLSVKCLIWSGAISTFPGNMREAESRRYPFASGGDDSTPLPSLHSAARGDTELTLDAPSREAVAASLKDSASYLRDNNDWEPSVRVHGVLREVLAVPVRFHHADGSRDTSILAAADGSSRTASAHRISGVDPADIVYGYPEDEQAWRSHLGRTLQGSSLPPEDLTSEQAQLIRAATMPAKIVVGFRSDEGTGVTLSEAIQFIVGLTHIEPPRPWKKGSTFDAQAEAVLEDLRRSRRISFDAADYYAGLLTPDVAAARGFSGHADERAADVMNVVLNPKNRPILGQAIRRVTAKPRTSVGMIVQVGAELALRGWAPRSDRSARSTVDGVRDALQRMLNTASVHKHEWRVSHRAPEDLLVAALRELDSEGAPGPAARELGVLGSWSLVTGGFAKREVQLSPNKSPLGRVLETLIASKHGLRLLADAVTRTRQGELPRAVNAEGQPIDHLVDLENFLGDEKRSASYLDEHGTDDWLRFTFMVSSDPEPSAPLDQDRVSTPENQLDDAKMTVVVAVERLLETMNIVGAIPNYEGTGRLIDERGWQRDAVQALLRNLDKAADDMRRWGWIWEMTQRT